MREICREWDGLDQEEREAEAESLATTVAHEALHALSWAAASGGRTPAAVFTAGGENLVRRTIEGGDAAIDTLYPVGFENTTEDRVEAVTRWMTEDAVPAEIPALVAPIGSDVVMQGATAFAVPRLLEVCGAAALKPRP